MNSPFGFQMHRCSASRSICELSCPKSEGAVRSCQIMQVYFRGFPLKVFDVWRSLPEVAPMKATNPHRRQPCNDAACRLEPLIRAMAQCPAGQRACMLWALASRLSVVPDDERTLAFACILKAVRQLPCIDRMEPLTELGMRVADLPAADQACALRTFVAAVGGMPFELQVGPLVDLASRMMENAYSPLHVRSDGAPLLH